MRKLKETLSNALNGFEGKGLQKKTVKYMSYGEQIAFQPVAGQQDLRAKSGGRISKVLGENPDIAVLIEGPIMILM
jgi:chemotaxis protein MotB